MQRRSAFSSKALLSVARITQRSWPLKVQRRSDVVHAAWEGRGYFEGNGKRQQFASPDDTDRAFYRVVVMP